MEGLRWGLWAILVGICQLGAPHALAQQAVAPIPLETRQYVALSTGLEVALATTSLVRQRTSGALTKTDWSIQFSERHWTLGLKAENFSCQLTGFLWGQNDTDWLVSFAGSGGITGKEPLYVNGKAEWFYDAKIADHPTMNFHNVVKFGDHSAWGWTVASEIVVGGVLYGGVTGLGITITTGGAGTGVAIVIGARAATIGAAAAVTVSHAIQSISENPIEPPRPPERPSFPQRDEQFEAGKDKIAIGIAKEGQVIGFGGDGDLVLSGFIRKDTGTGTLGRR